jgi:Protein of unknown function (DUF2384)
VSRTLVLTRDKVDELLTMGLSAEELASAAATTQASIYARRREDPGRRSDLDRRLGRLYFVVSELRERQLDDDQIIGWLTSPSPHLDGDTPLERFERDGLDGDEFKLVREAARSWWKGEPATAFVDRMRDVWATASAAKPEDETQAELEHAAGSSR